MSNKIENGLDVQRIMSEQIEMFLNKEIKSDALNSLSGAMKQLMAPCLAKLTQAKINKEKIKLNFLNCEL